MRLCHAGLDSKTLRVEALRLLRKVIPVDSFWFATADPATLLFTSSVVEDVSERATTAFLVNEFQQADVKKWVELARASRPANGLYLATHGQPDVVPGSDGPGVLVLADDYSAVATTPAAERWLAELADWPRRRELPQAIYGVSTRLRALERDGAVRPDLMLRVRVRTRSGRWLVLHGSRLGISRALGWALTVWFAEPSASQPGSN